VHQPILVVKSFHASGFERLSLLLAIHWKPLTALEWFYIRQSAWYQSIGGEVNWNDFTVLISRHFNVETPQQTSKVEKDAAFGDM